MKKPPLIFQKVINHIRKRGRSLSPLDDLSATESDVVTTSHIFIGPPGVGKTYFSEKYPHRFIDPETSISWKTMDVLFNPYSGGKLRDANRPILEYELRWVSVWIEEVLPRIWTAFLLKKDVLMGMITPSNAEVVACFLEGLRQQTTLFLPDTQEHYSRFSSDSRRSRSWGSEIRGWQNTFWVRLLLRGLASEIGLRVEKDPSISSQKEQCQRLTSTRDVIDDQGRRYLEVFLNRWVEIDKNEEIVAFYKQESIHDAIITLRCDKKSRVCEKGQHECDALRRIVVDREWIATDKLCVSPKTNNRNAIIFFAGSLAPFHRGHMSVMNAARKHLLEQGWNVLGGYASVFSELWEGRTGSVYSTIGSAEVRSIFLQLGARNSDWIMPDFPVKHVLEMKSLSEKTHPTQSIVKRLRRTGVIPESSSVTTFWVNGKDAHIDKSFFAEFAKQANQDPLNPLRMLIVDNRDGEDLWSQENIRCLIPELEPLIDRCRFRDSDPTSATRVRAALENGDRMALRNAVGIPAVQAYLMGLMYDSH